MSEKAAEFPFCGMIPGFNKNIIAYIVKAKPNTMTYMIFMIMLRTPHKGSKTNPPTKTIKLNPIKETYQ